MSIQVAKPTFTNYYEDADDDNKRNWKINTDLGVAAWL